MNKRRKERTSGRTPEIYTESHKACLKRRATRVAVNCAMSGSRPKVGLVLQGGGAKGAFQYGVIRELKESIWFDCIAGTSVGALNGAILASGKWDVGDRLWGNLDRRQIFSMSPARSIFALTMTFSRIYFEYIRGTYAIGFPRLLTAALDCFHGLAILAVSVGLFNMISYLFFGESRLHIILAMVLGCSMFIYIALHLRPMDRVMLEIARGVFCLMYIAHTAYLFFAGRGIELVEISPFLPLLLPTPILLLGWLAHTQNLTLFSPAPLKNVAKDVCKGGFSMPLWVTLAEEIEEYYDPDNYEYAKYTKADYWTLVTRTIASPRYELLNKLSDSETVLINSAALPIGVIPYRKEKSGSVLVDGGAADNTPWYPLISEFCDVIVIVSCGPKEEDAKVSRNRWLERERFLRVVAQKPKFTNLFEDHISQKKVKNSPPTNVPFAASNPPIPTVFHVVPERSLGGFFLGTLRFSAKKARRDLAEGERVGKIFSAILSPLAKAQKDVDRN